jgi:hypothetical protein
MCKTNDALTTSYDWFENEELDWFWTIVEQGQHRRKQLEAILLHLDQATLLDFERLLLDSASMFTEAPFLPPEFGESDDWVRSAAQWVVSQGKNYCLEVVKHPDLFGKLLRSDDEYDAESSYEGIAGRVWRTRFHEDMPPS